MIHANSVKQWEAETETYRAEIQRLRAARDELFKDLAIWKQAHAEAKAEIERLKRERRERF